MKDESPTWDWIFKICMIIIPIQAVFTGWVCLQIISLSNFRASTEVILNQGIPPKWVMTMVNNNTKELSNLNSTLLKFAFAKSTQSKD